MASQNPSNDTVESSSSGNSNLRSDIIGLSALADPYSTFSSTIDPISDAPVQPVRRQFTTGGWDAPIENRMERPQLAFNLGEKYRWDDSIGLEARARDQQRRLKEQRRAQLYGRRVAARPTRTEPSTTVEQDDSMTSQDSFNFLDGVSSGDDPSDEEDDEEKQRKRKKIRERRQQAYINGEDLDDLDYEDEELSEKEEIDMDMRLQQRREELRAHVAYVKKKKDNRTLLGIVEPSASRRLRPSIKAQRTVGEFNAKNELQILGKISGPSSFILGRAADLMMEYEKNKKITDENRNLHESFQICREQEDLYLAKLLSNLDMKETELAVISSTLDQDMELIKLIDNPDIKQRKEQEYERKFKLLEEIRLSTCNIQNICSNNVNPDEVSSNATMNVHNIIPVNSEIREWPSFCSRKERLTAREISTFLLRNKGDAFQALDIKGNNLLEKVLRFTKDHANFSTEDYSIIVDFNEKEPDLRHRPRQCLRPVLIDGCGAAYAYDREYAPLFYGPSKFSPYLRERVLPVYPLVSLALRMTLMGYKIAIVLPKYYEEPYFKAQKRLKVDDLYAFKKLVEAKLISFWDPADNESLMDMMKDKAQQVGAVIITDSHVDGTYAYRKRLEVSENTNEDELYEDLHQLLDANEADQYKKMMKIEKLRGNCADRVLSVCFQTIRKDMFITREFHDVIEVGEVDHSRRKYNYYRIGEDVTLFYSELDGDVRDETIRHNNQLMFKEQVEQALVLCPLFELTKVHLWACMIFLGFVHKRGIATEQIEQFVEDNVPFSAPNADNITLAQLNLADKEAENYVLREQLNKQKLSWNQKFQMLEEKKARCTLLAEKLGFMYEFGDEDEDSEKKISNLHISTTDTN